ncbi:hypothetical protein [Megasphaera hominis]|uniref:Malic enzyme N-terminal domain-containing protein n=1 Tax=Megasphaera hominis TaxID=159836 RepID=A0ABR6VLI4_9FIRM|nr:hypothetical protein [Megasphaera hominis]
MDFRACKRPFHTGRGSTVAVSSDGSAVLGLGYIGPEAGMPVTKGKVLLLFFP